MSRRLQQLRVLVAWSISYGMRDARMGWCLGLFMLAAMGGWWWRDLNFGHEENRFLLNYGLSVQAFGAALLAITGTLHLAMSIERDGTLPVMLARGISSRLVIAGNIVGVAMWVGVLVTVTALATAVALRCSGHAIPYAELGGAGLAQVIKALVIIAFTRWFSSYGNGAMFVVSAASLLALVGHLKPWTLDLGGMAWLLTRPVPNLAWLGAVGQDAVNLGGAVFYALGYVVVLGMLAARSLRRGEY